MSSEQDYNAMVSGAKIEPLESPAKRNVAHDDHGVIGEDKDVGQAHEEPLHSEVKHHHTQLPHADSQGIIGRDEAVQGSKIDPLAGGFKQAMNTTPGLDDETVDAARINPMGGVREE